ncbi:MAG TPA: hypothetical protein DDX98_11195 [Bacteroidales bacterium]|jgi:tetratricopeptide (TPR) repeat protein|nr:hypothetical protein [Bacteroidales bacterium]
MKTRYCFLFFLIICFSSASNAQSDSKQKLYQAFLQADLTAWEKEMTLLQKNTNVNDLEEGIVLINCYYGYIGWLINEEEFDKASSALDDSEDLLNDLLKKNPRNATLNAFKGAWYGFAINISGYKAAFLGPRSMKYINRSLDMDPLNIQGNIEKGNALYFMPEAFGGSKSKALELFNKAVSLMEKQELTDDNWLYLQMLARIGLMLQETGQHQAAAKQYETILENYPNYKWVRDDLYPAVKKEN